MNLLSLLFSSIFFLGQADAVSTKNQNDFKSFFEWCSQYENLSNSTQSTIDYLLKNAERENCYEAAAILSRVTELTSQNSIRGDFRPIASLPHIVSIEVALTNCQECSANLEPLSNMHNLQSVKIYSGRIDNITPLSNLKKITHLELQSDGFDDLSPLANLNQLKVLYVGDTEAIFQDLSPLSNLSNLEELTLNKIDLVNDLSPLSSLQNLRYLKIRDGYFTDINPLSSLLDLTSLHFHKTPLLIDIDDSPSHVIQSLYPLSYLDNLSELSITGHNIYDIEPLSNLANLIHLDLQNNQIDNLDPLSTLYNLESLNLERNNIKDIRALSSLKNLRSLYLAANTDLDNDLSPLVNLVALQSLGLPGTITYEDMIPLEDMPQWETMHIQRGRCRC